MELRRYLAILRRHGFIVVLTVAVALGVGWAATSRVHKYSAQATLFVGTRSFAINPQTNLPASDPLVAAQLASSTFAKMITSLPTAQLAIERSGIARSPATAVAETSATPVTNTTLLQIKVVDANPSIASSLANAEATAFVEEIQRLEPAGQGGGLPVSLFEAASPPTSSIPSPLRRNVELSGVFGALAAVALAFLLEYVDLTVRSVATIRRRIELPVLGAVPPHRVRA